MGPDTGEFIAITVSDEEATKATAILADKLSSAHEAMEKIVTRLHSYHIARGLSDPGSLWTDCIIIGCRLAQDELIIEKEKVTI